MRVPAVVPFLETRSGISVHSMTNQTIGSPANFYELDYSTKPRFIASIQVPISLSSDPRHPCGMHNRGHGLVSCLSIGLIVVASAGRMYSNLWKSLDGRQNGSTRSGGKYVPLHLINDDSWA